MKSRLIKKGSDIYISEPKRNVITKYKVFIVFFMLYIPTKMMSQFELKGFMDSTFDKDIYTFTNMIQNIKHSKLLLKIRNSNFMVNQILMIFQFYTLKEITMMIFTMR